MNIDNLMKEAEDCQDAADLMLRETSRITSAWHRINRDLMLLMYREKMHVYFTLHEIRDSMTDITKRDLGSYSTTVDDLHYEDHETLAEPELIDRTRTYFQHLEILAHKLETICRTIKPMGMLPVAVGLAASHLSIEVRFLANDLNRIGIPTK